MNNLMENVFLRRLVFLLVASSTIAIISFPAADAQVLDLVHLDHLARGQPVARSQRLARMFARDMARMERRRMLGSSTTGLVSLADMHSGEFAAKMAVGTPPQNLWMVADTASDLTWMKCTYAGNGNWTGGKFFLADNSNSFALVKCLHKGKAWSCPNEIEDAFDPVDWCRISGNCAYDYSYAIGMAYGDFARETITTNTAKFRNHLVGCTYAADSLDDIMGASYGILGLGSGKFSFVSQTSVTFGSLFSYCLVDHLSHLNVPGSLAFGPHPKPKTSGPTSCTELIPRVNNTFYGVKVEGIRVNGADLKIPRDTWKIDNYGRSGTIVDLGQSFTSLNDEAYKKVMSSLNGALSGFKRVRPSKTDTFEYCYHIWSNQPVKNFPLLEIVFEGGSVFVPEQSALLIDYKQGVKCLGFVKNGGPYYNVIGNILQQKHWFSFDTPKRQLCFASASCCAS
ncbi:eukaryotic aspartyl protease family protein [Striga asiatica]|uniref:Eukaryotic aspartyl protease family protein n=1 Tax=Striga asiatica TaxID=4170 RepID=A0A5A7QW86_STRAF|nr:eukaryotic aspartyl protease family protein [Striga asiatica]